MDIRKKRNDDASPSTIKKSKSRWLILSTLVAILIGGGILFSINNQYSKDIVDEANDQSSQSIRKPSDLAIQIAQYEVFYLDYAFHSSKKAQFFGLTDLLNSYALINYLSDTEIAWDDEKRTFYRNQIVDGLQYDRQNETYNQYMDKLLAHFNITENQYIDEYLLPTEEARRLKNEMFSKFIKLQDGGYPSSIVENEFYRQMGYSSKMLDEMVEEEPKPEPLNPQPTDLAFTRGEFMSKIGLNEQGQYVFVDPEYATSDLTDDQREDLYELENRILKQPLNRIHLSDYIKAAKEAAFQELVVILEILERSVEHNFENK